VLSKLYIYTKNGKTGFNRFICFLDKQNGNGKYVSEQVEQYRDQFMKIIKNCYTESHNFLYINTNSQRMFCNWNEILIEEK